MDVLIRLSPCSSLTVCDDAATIHYTHIQLFEHTLMAGGKRTLNGLDRFPKFPQATVSGVPDSVKNNRQHLHGSSISVGCLTFTSTKHMSCHEVMYSVSTPSKTF